MMTDHIESNRKNNSPDLFDRVRELILREHLIPKDSLIIAAVSGGADSMALLLILSDMRAILPFSLHCVHVHHGLRGPDADADLFYVRDWCRRLSVPFHARHIDVSQKADLEKIGLELAARQARLSVFRELSEALRLEQALERPARIALAHHMDDQAETLLMHLGRGTGLDGLSGMRLDDGFMIRPLLYCRRSDIETWLSEKQISWRQDHTNEDDFTVRNRLRHLVLPAFSEALRYDPVPLLSRAADHLASDRDFLDECAREAFMHGRRDKGLSVTDLLVLHPALQVRVIRLFWEEQTGGVQSLGHVHYQMIQNWLLSATTGKGLDLPGGWRLVAAYGTIVLKKRAGSECDRESNPSPIRVNIPGVTRSEDLKVQIEAELIENDDEIVYNGAMEYFRLERIQGCELRRCLPGDRIRPYGRSHSKLLKKFFQEQRVLPEERSRLVLLALGNDVVWLPGYASGADYVVRPGDEKKGPLVRMRLTSIHNGNT